MTNELPCWFKSSYSENGGACVEVAANLAAAYDAVSVRDSKDPHGPTLAFDTTAWTAFVAGVKAGDFPA
ncbi:DUF397 domain-containing protein [Streptomyces sp. AC563]|uniref:DUF397 domain-containing protein n=1 Tax=Streptomyces buecherae TaxID=2763006 RepID=UPI00164DB028|nr:DUF397 domain-containing protein [Streptomyces buecherae]MBC3991077.1 DUF397 domain-containing protein [Streptomyces buecherae]